MLIFLIESILHCSSRLFDGTNQFADKQEVRVDSQSLYLIADEYDESSIPLISALSACSILHHFSIENMTFVHLF